MIDFTVGTQIAREPDEVFAYVTDPATLASWQTNTVSAVKETEGPMAVGSRIREVHRGPVGREFAELVEVIRYEPGRAFDLHVVEGPPIDAQLTFEPADGGTRMRFRVHGQPTGMMRLLQPVLRPALKRSFAGYCENLKQVMEAGEALNRPTSRA